jgi:hypothetical protein
MTDITIKPVCPFNPTIKDWIPWVEKDCPAASPEPEQKEVLPDWIYAGAKVFVGNNLRTITAIIPNKRIDFTNKDIETSIPWSIWKEQLTQAILIPWSETTGPDGFIDQDGKMWRKCVSFDEKMEWGYVKFGDRCWCLFEYLMKNHKQASGEPCGEWVRKVPAMGLFRCSDEDCNNALGFNHDEDCRYDGEVLMKHCTKKIPASLPRPECFGNYKMGGLCQLNFDDKNKCSCDTDCKLKLDETITNMKNKTGKPGRS